MTSKLSVIQYHDDDNNIHASRVSVALILGFAVLNTVRNKCNVLPI